jgi:hypothetical protein
VCVRVRVRVRVCVRVRMSWNIKEIKDKLSLIDG